MLTTICLKGDYYVWQNSTYYINYWHTRGLARGYVNINSQKQKIKELEKYQKENENYKEKYEQLLKENKSLKEQLKNSYDY